MTADYIQTLYENDLIKLSIIDNALVLKLYVNNNLLISSWHNDGYKENMVNVLNQSLTNDDYPYIEENNIKTFQQKRMKELGLNSAKSTGLITSACMDNHAISVKSYEQLRVISIVTAGADNNAIKAGDPSSFYEYNNNYKSIGGTINIITFIDANLDAGALTTALVTITEAKSSLLQDLKIKSNYSTNIATGTGTDGVCVISNKSSKNHLENAGKHSKLGELIALSVYEATKKALFLETNMSREYQTTVLSRLSRFNISFYDLYENSNISDIGEYAKLFNLINDDNYILSSISSILNLIDEVQSSLLTVNDISKTIEVLLNAIINEDIFYNFESIDDVIQAIIDTLNKLVQKMDKKK